MLKCWHKMIKVETCSVILHTHVCFVFFFNTTSMHTVSASMHQCVSQRLSDRLLRETKIIKKEKKMFLLPCFCAHMYWLVDVVLAISKPGALLKHLAHSMGQQTPKCLDTNLRRSFLKRTPTKA